MVIKPLSCLLNFWFIFNILYFIFLVKGTKAHQRKISSARLIVYTAHFIRAGLDFQDRVPVLSVLGLPLDMVRARVKFWSGTDGPKSFTRLNLSVPNQFFWYAYFFHPSRAKNFRPCKWGLNVNYLGKVIFEPMLVSSFLYYAWGSMIASSRAPSDLYTQSFACGSSQSVFAIALLLACHLCAVFFPTLPLFFRAR